MSHPLTCYMPIGGTDDGRCPNEALYEAFVDWTAGIMLFCEEHALVARADNAVGSIRKIAFTRIKEDERP